MAGRLTGPDRATTCRLPVGGQEGGSALLLVLFTILLISGLIVSAVEFVKSDVDEYAALNHQFRARQLASTGLAFGLNPVVRNEDRSLLEQNAPDGGKFTVLIISESTRLNINFLFQSQRDYLLSQLFSRWNLNGKDISNAIKGLREWVGVGPAATASSSSTPGQQNTADNAGNATDQAAGTNQNATEANSATTSTVGVSQLARPFQAVAEMSLVPAFAAVMQAQPDWASYFTVYGDGKIDVNQADADMIRLVTGVSPAQADRFVKYRWGRDGKPNTSDDQQYLTLEQVRAALGLSAEQFQITQNLLSLTSAIDRVECVGQVAGYTRAITVIASRNTNPVQFLVWQEK